MHDLNDYGLVLAGKIDTVASDTFLYNVVAGMKYKLLLMMLCFESYVEFVGVNDM